MKLSRDTVVESMPLPMSGGVGGSPETGQRYWPDDQPMLPFQSWRYQPFCDSRIFVVAPPGRTLRIAYVDAGPLRWFSAVALHTRASEPGTSAPIVCGWP